MLFHKFKTLLRFGFFGFKKFADRLESVDFITQRKLACPFDLLITVALGQAFKPYKNANALDAAMLNHGLCPSFRMLADQADTPEKMINSEFNF